MPLEIQKTNGHAEHSFLVRIPWLILCEICVLFIALYAVSLITTHVAPLYVDDSLSSGSRQYGWPMPYTADDDATDKDFYDFGAGHFNGLAYLVNLLLFYIPIRLIAPILKQIGTRAVQKYDSQRYIDRLMPYLRRIVLVAVGIVISYYMFILFTQRPTFNTGLNATAPIHVSE